jgi:hypothetical protein
MSISAVCCTYSEIRTLFSQNGTVHGFQSEGKIVIFCYSRHELLECGWENDATDFGKSGEERVLQWETVAPEGAGPSIKG